MENIEKMFFKEDESVQEEQPAQEEEPVLCKHGANPFECDACFLEKQPAWESIKHLEGDSDFKRSSETSANCTIESEGKKFSIEVVESGKDPALSDVQELLKSAFGKEEVDPEEIMRSSVDGLTPWETEDKKYRIVLVRNENNELVTLMAGAQLGLLNEKGEPTDESVYFGGYAVTGESSRQQGLAREAYISSLIDAVKEARMQGRTLKFAIGECTHTSEKYWNKVGWKRMYIQTDDNKEYSELKYMQPALDYDPDTGEIEEGAGETPEHLMVDTFGSNPPNKEQISRAYDSLISYCTRWPKEAFSSSEAYEKQGQYISGIASKFKEFLNNNGKMIFLDAENRIKARKQGITINDYVEADHGEAGKEDF